MTTRPVCQLQPSDKSEVKLTLHTGRGDIVILLVHPQTGDTVRVWPIRVDFGALIAQDMNHSIMRPYSLACQL